MQRSLVHLQPAIRKLGDHPLAIIVRLCINDAAPPTVLEDEHFVRKHAGKKCLDLGTRCKNFVLQAAAMGYLVAPELFDPHAVVFIVHDGLSAGDDNEAPSLLPAPVGTDINRRPVYDPATTAVPGPDAWALVRDAVFVQKPADESWEAWQKTCSACLNYCLAPAMAAEAVCTLAHHFILFALTWAACRVLGGASAGTVQQSVHSVVALLHAHRALGSVGDPSADPMPGSQKQLLRQCAVALASLVALVPEPAAAPVLRRSWRIAEEQALCTACTVSVVTPATDTWSHGVIFQTVAVFVYEAREYRRGGLLRHAVTVADTLCRSARALLFRSESDSGSRSAAAAAAYVLHTVARVVAMGAKVYGPYMELALEALDRFADVSVVTRAALQVCLCVALMEQPVCGAGVRVPVLAAIRRLHEGGLAAVSPETGALQGHVLFALLARAEGLHACLGVFDALVHLAASYPAVAALQLWQTRAVMHVLTHGPTAAAADCAVTSAALAVWRRVAPERVRALLPCAQPCCPKVLASLGAALHIPWSRPHEDIVVACMARCSAKGD
jgi:hypothetical protein